MMKTVSWNGTNISGDDTLCEQLLMTHSILKQFFFFFSRCYKSCFSDIFTCNFFIVSVRNNLFSAFQVYFIFYDMIMQYKTSNKVCEFADSTKQAFF